MSGNTIKTKDNGVSPVSDSIYECMRRHTVGTNAGGCSEWIRRGWDEG